MVSVVDICNLSLSHIGDRATLTSIDPPEGSAQSDHCARFWPIARDEALSGHDWGFARRTASLAQLATQDNPDWAYAFARPADMLVARGFRQSDGGQVALYPGHPYFEEGVTAANQPVFFANTDLSSLRYTRRVTDASVYPSIFVTAVSYLLASYLAGAVVKGRAGAQLAGAMRAAAMQIMSQAATVDANQSHESTKFRPSQLAARGYAGDTGRTVTDSQGALHELPFWAQG